jgi:hypothetical protein
LITDLELVNSSLEVLHLDLSEFPENLEIPQSIKKISLRSNGVFTSRLKVSTALLEKLPATLTSLTAEVLLQEGSWWSNLQDSALAELRLSSCDHLDLRRLPLKLETLVTCSRGDGFGDHFNHVRYPNEDAGAPIFNFPPSLTYLVLASVVVRPKDIKFLPKTLRHLHMGISSEWTDLDLFEIGRHLSCPIILAIGLVTITQAPTDGKREFNVMEDILAALKREVGSASRVNCHWRLPGPAQISLPPSLASLILDGSVQCPSISSIVQSTCCVAHDLEEHLQNLPNLETLIVRNLASDARTIPNYIHFGVFKDLNHLKTLDLTGIDISPAQFGLDKLPRGLQCFKAKRFPENHVALLRSFPVDSTQELQPKSQSIESKHEEEDISPPKQAKKKKSPPRDVEEDLISSTDNAVHNLAPTSEICKNLSTPFIVTPSTSQSNALGNVFTTPFVAKPSLNPVPTTTATSSLPSSSSNVSQSVTDFFASRPHTLGGSSSVPTPQTFPAKAGAPAAITITPQSRSFDFSEAYEFFDTEASVVKLNDLPPGLTVLSFHHPIHPLQAPLKVWPKTLTELRIAIVGWKESDLLNLKSHLLPDCTVQLSGTIRTYGHTLPRDLHGFIDPSALTKAMNQVYEPYELGSWVLHRQGQLSLPEGVTEFQLQKKLVAGEWRFEHGEIEEWGIFYTHQLPSSWPSTLTALNLQSTDSQRMNINLAEDLHLPVALTHLTLRVGASDAPEPFKYIPRGLLYLFLSSIIRFNLQPKQLGSLPPNLLQLDLSQINIGPDAIEHLPHSLTRIRFPADFDWYDYHLDALMKHLPSDNVTIGCGQASFTGHFLPENLTDLTTDCISSTSWSLSEDRQFEVYSVRLSDHKPVTLPESVLSIKMFDMPLQDLGSFSVLPSNLLVLEVALASELVNDQLKLLPSTLTSLKIGFSDLRGLDSSFPSLLPRNLRSFTLVQNSLMLGSMAVLPLLIGLPPHLEFLGLHFFCQPEILAFEQIPDSVKTLELYGMTDETILAIKRLKPRLQNIGNAQTIQRPRLRGLGFNLAGNW